MEFCKCGSVMINGSCTNKNCSNKQQKAPKLKEKKEGSSKSAVSAKEDIPRPASKNTKVPRASKCITYPISELYKKEEQK